MGFLVFAARKLQLKQRINQLGFRQLQLNQERQTLSTQIQNAQLRQQQAQNSINIFNAQMNSFGNIASYATGNNGFSNAAQMFGNYSSNVSNSIFMAKNNAELTRLNAQDSMLDTEIENIESQLQLLRQEYESVKKAESNEVQNATPTFGLA